MAHGIAGVATGDAMPRVEHARPPGWRPPVHPPPVPVAPLPVAASRPAPPPVRPRPAPAATVGASGVAAVPAQPTVPGRPEGFGILAWFLGFRLVGRAADLLMQGAAADAQEALARMVEAGSVALGAALVVGLWRCERWVGRAAVFWAASLAVLRIVGEMEEGAYYSVSDFIWGSLFLAMILPMATAAYVWDKAGKIPPPPSPAP